jgi:hydroxyacylglutathione hydrolase
MHNLRFSPPSWASSKRQISNTVLMQAALQIDLVPCLVDNYAYLLHDSASGVTGVVDPSAAGPVIDALNKRGLSLTYILNTHHHWDHTGGNAELKKKYNAKVVGPRADEERIPGIDLALRDGQIWMFGEQEMQVLDTPGHTRGHVSFYFKQSKAVFTGDTLFSIGCGRLFEGSPEQMWMSLSKLAGLPDDTLVYCGHEYTLSNAKFAITVEPDNKRLKSRLEQVKELRQKGLATIPSTLGEEKETNPFLRPFSAGLRKTMKVPADASDIQAFAAVRAAKDRA